MGTTSISYRLWQEKSASAHTKKMSLSQTDMAEGKLGDQVLREYSTPLGHLAQKQIPDARILDFRVTMLTAPLINGKWTVEVLIEHAQ